MREATNGASPTYLLLENVPGLLSSNGGRDFAVVLGELAQLGALDIAWRVLDAQWFGLAQRRARLFIVVDFGGERAAQILFEPEGGSRNPPPRREAGEGTARGAAYSVAVRGRDDGQEWELGAPELGNALRAGDGGSSRGNWAVVPPLAACLTRREGKGPDSDATTTLIPTTARTLLGKHNDSHAADLETYIPAVAHTLTSEGFDAGEDGTGRGTPLVPVAYQCQGTNVGEMGTLRSGNGHVTGGVPFVASVALRTRDGGHIAELGGDLAPALFASQGGGDKAHVMAGMAVRRLTPTECERLQGFPDGWTQYGVGSVRFCGNIAGTEIRRFLQCLTHAELKDATDRLLTGRRASASCTTSASSGAGQQITLSRSQGRMTPSAESVTARLEITALVDSALDTISHGNATVIPFKPNATPLNAGGIGRDTLRAKMGGTPTSLWLNVYSDGPYSPKSESTISTWTSATMRPTTSMSAPATPIICGCIIHWNSSPKNSCDGESFTLTVADTTFLSDSTRYRMLGNAVAVPCAEWIGRRILEEV
jgi:site-specific DNA-cytosine methylase